ncbi:P-loop containing nucleoside triphosphate hydrolase protein [Phyllosticta capitalensis]
MSSTESPAEQMASGSATAKTRKEVLDRDKAVIKASEENPKGSCIIDVQGIINSAPRMAGYLHLDVQAIHKFRLVKDDANTDNTGQATHVPHDITGWISLFAAARDRLKPTGSKSTFGIEISVIKELLGNSEFAAVLGNMFREKTRTIPLPDRPPPCLSREKAQVFFKSPPTAKVKRKERKRQDRKWAHLTVLFVVHRILELLPSGSLTGALCSDFDDTPRIFGFHVEDWVRGVCLLRFAIGHPVPPNYSPQSRKEPQSADYFTSADVELAKTRSIVSDECDSDYADGDDDGPTNDSPFIHAVPRAYLGKVLKGIFDVYGRNSIQFPRQEAANGPLSYFYSSGGQNPNQPLVDELDDEDEDERSEEPRRKIWDDAESFKRFNELQAALNKTTAKARTIEEACKALKLPRDPAKWTFGNDRPLKSHQVLSLDWALAMVFNLGFAYISSDSGLGKTTVAAALIDRLAAKKRAQVDHNPELNPQIYKPTLVLVPRAGMVTWFEELGAFPSITAYQWVGEPSKAITDRGIGTSIECLIGTLDSFDKNNPVTARQVIITTYTKYRSMTMERKGGYATPTDTPNDEDATDEQEDGEERDNFDNFRSVLEGRFGLVILDEAHKTKNPRTSNFASVSKTCPEFILGLTSTPIMQTPRDLHGLIRLAWQMAVSRKLVAEETNVHPDREFYANLAKDLETSAIADARFLPLLHPASFKEYLDYSTAHSRLVPSAKHSQQVARPIMRFCFLRFHKGQDLGPFGLDDIVGGDIPPYKPVVVELKLDEHQQKIHDRWFRKLIRDLHRGSYNESEFGFYECGQLNPIAHKELVQSTSNCFSGKILEYVKESVPADEVHELMKTFDGGFRFLFRAIMSAENIPKVPIYTRGKDRAQFIASFHPKWGYLAGILHEVLCKRKTKLLVFVSSPVTHQILDLFLQCLGIKHLSLNSSVEPHDRDMCFKRFNDPEGDIEVMTMNTNLGACAFNAQRACYVSVLLEFPIFPSPRLFDQLIGRTWRMGQREESMFITVTTVASYDHILQGRFAHKAIVQTAVLGDLRAQDDADDGDDDAGAANSTPGAGDSNSDPSSGAEDSSNEEDLDQQIERNDPNDQAIQDLIKKTTPLYMEAYGFSSPRHGWHRASLEQLLRAGTAQANAGPPNAARAETVVAPNAADANRPAATQTQDQSDAAQNEAVAVNETTAQPTEEQPGLPAPARADSVVLDEQSSGSQPADVANDDPVRTAKRAASSEPENPAKRQASREESWF